jgi:hypothetical protein
MRSLAGPAEIPTHYSPTELVVEGKAIAIRRHRVEKNALPGQV